MNKKLFIDALPIEDERFTLLCFASQMAGWSKEIPSVLHEMTISQVRFERDTSSDTE